MHFYIQIAARDEISDCHNFSVEFFWIVSDFAILDQI